MPDVKGTLFWLFCVLVCIIWLARGCESRFDRWQNYRDQRRQYRQEWFGDRREQREDRKQSWGEWWSQRERFRDRRREQ
jgi:hypothetical protein